MPLHEASLTAIIIAVIGLVGGYLTFTQARRSNIRRESGEAVTEWRDLYAGVMKENSRLRLEIADLRKELAELEVKLTKLDERTASDRLQWEIERARLYRRIYNAEHVNDDTPPPTGKRSSP